MGLKPPTNIAETLKAAKKIHSPLNGMSGIAWNAARGTPLGHSFLYAMAAFGQPVLNLNRLENGFDGENVAGENCRPMFDTEIALEAAEYLKELLDFSPRHFKHVLVDRQLPTLLVVQWLLCNFISPTV